MSPKYRVPTNSEFMKLVGQYASAYHTDVTVFFVFAIILQCLYVCLAGTKARSVVFEETLEQTGGRLTLKRFSDTLGTIRDGSCSGE